MADEGMELPAWRDRSEAWFHLQWLMKAFWNLTTSRQMAMGGEGYIQIDQIVSYCDLIGLREPEARLEFFELIRAIDLAFLDEKRKMREDDKTKPGSAK